MSDYPHPFEVISPSRVEQLIADALAEIGGGAGLTVEQVQALIDQTVDVLTAADVGAVTPSQAESIAAAAVAGVTASTLGVPTTTQMMAAIAAAVAAIPAPTARRTSGSLKAGVPIGTYDFPSASGSVTCRVGYVAPAGGIADLDLEYDNWTLQGSSGSGTGQVGGETNGANPLSLKAAIEYGGVSTPAWWPNGARTVTLDPGAFMRTRTTGLFIPAGATYYVRTFASYTGTFPASGYAPDASTTGSGYSAGDVADSTGAPTNASASSGLLAPSVVTARPATPYAVVAIMGDSISVGTGDNINNGGYIRRALGTIPNITLGRGSERASTTVPPNLHARRFRYLDLGTHMIEEYGVNDIGNNQPLATIQANMLTLWREGATRGLKVWATTTTPSTSNDTNKETVRVALNTWLRDGAPLGAAGGIAAAGSTTAGTVRAGQAGHPLTGYFEIADLVETSRNSGVYKPGYSDDGTHLSPGGCVVAAGGIDTTRLTV